MRWERKYRPASIAVARCRQSISVVAKLFWMMVLFLALLMNGCRWNQKPAPLSVLSQPEFNPFYQLLEELPEVQQVRDDERKVTLSASGMLLTDFLRYMADEAGISIVCDQSLDSSVVCFGFRNFSRG